MDGYFLLIRGSDRPHSRRMRALKNEWSRYEIEKQRRKGKKIYFLAETYLYWRHGWLHLGSGA